MRKLARLNAFIRLKPLCTKRSTSYSSQMERGNTRIVTRAPGKAKEFTQHCAKIATAGGREMQSVAGRLGFRSAYNHC